MNRLLLFSKSITFLIVAASFLIFAYSALAEDSSDTSKTRKSINEARMENKMAQMEDRKEGMQAKLQMRREEIASNTAQLRERLQKFKDKVKANLADKINTVLGQINQKQTSQMLKHLDRMSEILTRVENRATEASASGQNISSASAAIADAWEAIDNAKTSVNDQELKDYTINVGLEGTIRADAKKSRDALHQDLKDVRQLVIVAKQAVAKAIQTTALILGGNK
jgi:hypothetical protein